MYVDFLEEGSDECPLIRLSQGKHEDYDNLVYSINHLIGNNLTFDVLLLQGFQHDNTISALIIDIASEDKDIVESPKGYFFCTFSKAHLLNIIEMLKKYQIEGRRGSYYWLNDGIGTQILLSVSGQW